jgi:four helix bundle protein
MGDFKELAVWQEARVLVKDVYLVTGRFPSSERYGLECQLRRAAVSIASNVAEGAAVGGDRAMLRHLRIARGSSAEVECQLLLARDTGCLSEDSWRRLDSQARRVGRMLTALIRALAPPAR